MRYFNTYDALFAQVDCVRPTQHCTTNTAVKITGRVEKVSAGIDQKLAFNIGEIWATSPKNAQVDSGDQISLIGTLEKRLINDKKYIYWLVNPQIVSLSRSSNETAFSVYRWHYEAGRVRSYLYNRLRTYMTPTRAGLVAGILFGEKKDLPDKFYDALIATGTVHIIVASGYNISIIVSFMTFLLLRLFSRPVAIGLTTIGIGLYVLLAGGEIPVLRAAFMAVLLLLAQATGRYYQAFWALIVVIIGFLIWEPLLVHDLSFQLSVAATFGLLVLHSRILKLCLTLLEKGISLFTINRNPNTTNKWVEIALSDLSTSISATIVTIPIILINFDILNWFSPVINTLILWTIPPIMVLGAGVLLLDVFSRTLADFLWLFLNAFLTYFAWIIEFVASFEWVGLTIKGLNWWFGFGYYFLLISFLIKKVKKLDI